MGDGPQTAERKRRAAATYHDAMSKHHGFAASTNVAAIGAPVPIIDAILAFADQEIERLIVEGLRGPSRDLIAGLLAHAGCWNDEDGAAPPCGDCTGCRQGRAARVLGGGIVARNRGRPVPPALDQLREAFTGATLGELHDDGRWAVRFTFGEGDDARQAMQNAADTWRSILPESTNSEATA